MFLGRYLSIFQLMLLALPTWAGVGPKPKVSQTIFCNQQRAPITPENTIFAFDFHDVITTSKGWPKWRTRTRILWDCPYRNTLFKYAPSLLYTLLSIRKQLNVAEQAFKEVIDMYPELALCKQTFLDIANAQRPNKKTQAIMKQLSEKGFKLYLFSNIGEETFEDLRTRHPDLLFHLNGFCYVKASTGYISKPDPRMYQQFNNECNKEGKQVIFVDDLLRNIRAGCDAGMISILFKDADQFYRDLETLGIFTHPSDAQLESVDFLPIDFEQRN